jgi:hypothetical protein
VAINLNGNKVKRINDASGSFVAAVQLPAPSYDIIFPDPGLVFVSSFEDYLQLNLIHNANGYNYLAITSSVISGMYKNMATITAQGNIGSAAVPAFLIPGNAASSFALGVKGRTGGSSAYDTYMGLGLVQSGLFQNEIQGARLTIRAGPTESYINDASVSNASPNDSYFIPIVYTTSPSNGFFANKFLIQRNS